MGDPSSPKPPSILLPPGCRFYPSEEQLVCYYLTHKNNDDRRFGFDAINEIDLYNYNPFDLPDTAYFRFGRGGRKRHCYCYVGTRVLKQGGRRRAGGGYWWRRGREKDVVGGGKVVVGTRRRFVFYLGDSLETAASTDWVMYEYGLIDRHEASFSLCRLFVKSTCQNNNSEHVLSSCGEGSLGTLRHIGIQHDGTITSGIVEGIVRDETSVDKKNEVLAGNASTTGAVAHAGVQVPLSVQPNEPVTASGLTGAASMSIGCFAAHHLMSTLEEDYIELDDLAGPLSGIDFT